MISEGKFMCLKKCFWGRLVAIGAVAILLTACGDDSSSGPSDSTSEPTEVSSSSKVKSSSSVGKVSSSSKKVASSSSASKSKLSSSVSKIVSSSSVKLTSSSSKAKSSSSSDAKQQSSAIIEDKSVSGVSQKGPFVTGSAVKLYELDNKTFAQTGKSFTGQIASNDGKFSVTSVTLASEYALLEVNGYFRNEVSGEKSKGSIKLNALTDLSDRDKVNINLLTHLEYKRALYLIGTGIDMASAKKQAEAEVFNAFGIQGEFANSEDLDIFSKGEGNAALLAFSVLMLHDLSETDLTEFLNKFATDIEKDGKWDDETTKAKIADWAQSKDLAGKLDSIRSNIEKWNLGTVPEFEKYVRNFWYTNYGLGSCDKAREGELMATKNELSSTYGTQIRYLCRGNVWLEAWDIVKDTYGEKCTDKDVGKTITGIVISTNKYYCMANGWVSLTGGWSWDVPKEARLNPEITYGTMTDSRDGKTYKTVKIGNQTWMAENLNYSDSVTTTSLIDESWCYNDVAANCDVAGRLYSWWAAIDYDKTGCGNGPICLTSLPVRGICPEGWHLPDSTEWNTLFAAVGGASTAGKMLKSQGGWNNDYDGSIVKGIDAYGFSALPAGHRYNNGFFSDEGRNARFWTASEDSSARDLSFRSGAYYVSLISSNEYAFIDSYVKSKGHSVRCLKN